MEGEKLIKTIVGQVGLPEQLMEKELKNMIVDSGHDVAGITLDQLRPILAKYLQTVLLESKESLG